jgi:hypothetical protein
VRWWRSPERMARPGGQHGSSRARVSGPVPEAKRGEDRQRRRTPDQRQASLRQASAADSCSVGSTTGAAPPAIPTSRQAPSRSSLELPSASARAPSFPTDSQDRTSTDALLSLGGTSSTSPSIGDQHAADADRSGGARGGEPQPHAAPQPAELQRQARRPLAGQQAPGLAPLADQTQLGLVERAHHAAGRGHLAEDPSRPSRSSQRPSRSQDGRWIASSTVQACASRSSSACLHSWPAVHPAATQPAPAARPEDPAEHRSGRGPVASTRRARRPRSMPARTGRGARAGRSSARAAGRWSLAPRAGLPSPQPQGRSEDSGHVEPASSVTARSVATRVPRAPDGAGRRRPEAEKRTESPTNCWRSDGDSAGRPVEVGSSSPITRKV